MHIYFLFKYLRLNCCMDGLFDIVYCNSHLALARTLRSSISPLLATEYRISHEEYEAQTIVDATDERLFEISYWWI